MNWRRREVACGENIEHSIIYREMGVEPLLNEGQGLELGSQLCE
jgi:hypothetical protein